MGSRGALRVVGRGRGLRGRLRGALGGVALALAMPAAWADGAGAAPGLPPGDPPNGPLSMRHKQETPQVPFELVQTLERRVDLKVEGKPFGEVLKTLSETAGIHIRAEAGTSSAPLITVNFQAAPLATLLGQIAKSTGWTIHPDLTGERPGILLAPYRPAAGGVGQRPFAPPNPWGPEWPPEISGRLAAASGFGASGFSGFPGGLNPLPFLRLPPSIRLTPQTITALDATHFLVLSTNQDVATPVRVGEGPQAVTVVMPMAVITLYRIENGRIVRESSTLHQIPGDDLRWLIQELHPGTPSSGSAGEKVNQ